MRRKYSENCASLHGKDENELNNYKETTPVKRFALLPAILYCTNILLLISMLGTSIIMAQKGKPGGPGGGGGGGCQTYSAPTDDSSEIGGGAGNLDGTFGTGGIVAAFPGDISPLIKEVKIQPDGKIVLFGWGGVGQETAYDLLVMRLNADGSTDELFGTSGPGYTLIDFTQASDYPGSGVVLASGKIIVGGYVQYSNGGVYKAVVAQLNDDGSLDTTFGNGGKLEIYNSQTPLRLQDIAVQPDGNLLLAGGDPRFTVVRITPNGTIDTGFGNSGFASAAPVSSGSGFGQSVSVALQSSGRIVVGGWSKKKSTDKEAFTLVAFTANGQLDGSFGSSGRSTAAFSEGASKINDIAVDSLNKIVAVGDVTQTCGGGSDSAFARFTAAGSLDTSFSSDGKHFQEVYGGAGSSLSVVIQDDGKILASGFAGKSNTAMPQDLSLIRLNSTGSLDPGFGPGLTGFFSSGVVTLRAGTIGASGRSVALADGKIIVAGSFGSNRVVARYWQ